jgi:hypothetical protein
MQVRLDEPMGVPGAFDQGLSSSPERRAPAPRPTRFGSPAMLPLLTDAWPSASRLRPWAAGSKGTFLPEPKKPPHPKHPPQFRRAGPCRRTSPSAGSTRRVPGLAAMLGRASRRVDGRLRFEGFRTMARGSGRMELACQRLIPFKSAPVRPEERFHEDGRALTGKRQFKVHRLQVRGIPSRASSRAHPPRLGSLPVPARLRAT